MKEPMVVQVRRMDGKWDMLESIEEAAQRAAAEGRALDVVWMSQTRDGGEYERGRFKIVPARPALRVAK